MRMLESGCAVRQVMIRVREEIEGSITLGHGMLSDKWCFI